MAASSVTGVTSAPCSPPPCCTGKGVKGLRGTQDGKGAESLDRNLPYKIGFTCARPSHLGSHQVDLCEFEVTPKSEFKTNRDSQ